MARPQQPRRRRVTGSLCPCVVDLNDDVRQLDALDGPLCKVNNDEKVQFFMKDDDNSCSEESSIDERDLFELWRHFDEDTISIDSRDDYFDIDDSTTAESNCLIDESTTCSALDQKQEKRVRFGTVTVREYDLTVGAYSAAKDTCPLQLSWVYAQPSVYTVDYHNCLKEFGKKRTLRRLTLEKRRKLIAKVQGISEGEVLLQEYEITLSTIQDTIKCMSFDITNTASEKSRHWSPSGTGHPKLGHDTLFTKSLLREMPPLPL